jgi:hypothetical protein
MFEIFLILSILSMAIYFVINVRPWYRSLKSKTGDVRTGSYIMGLLFCGLYYYSLPLLWWRYGLISTIKLILSCVALGALAMFGLRTTGLLKVEDFFDSLFYSQFVAVPIRAIAGTWLARNDMRWRRRAMQGRSASTGTEAR